MTQVSRQERPQKIRAGTTLVNKWLYVGKLPTSPHVVLRVDMGLHSRVASHATATDVLRAMNIPTLNEGRLGYTPWRFPRPEEGIQLSILYRAGCLEPIFGSPESAEDIQIIYRRGVGLDLSAIDRLAVVDKREYPDLPRLYWTCSMYNSEYALTGFLGDGFQKNYHFTKTPLLILAMREVTPVQLRRLMPPAP